MTKFEFIQKLGYLLMDIPEEERREAIEFYENYFEEAGSTEEEKVIRELGSPEEVAESIKKSLEYGNADNGYFSENGYHEAYKEKVNLPSFSRFTAVGVREDSNRSYEENVQDRRQDSNNRQNFDNKQEQNNRQGYNNKAGSGNYGYKTDSVEKRNPSKSPLNIVLIIILMLFALPIGLPIVITLLSVLFTVIIIIISLWISFLAISVSLLVVGIVLAVAGLFQLSAVPALGLSITGGGFILLAIGILFSIATIWLAGKALPAVLRWTKNLVGKIFHRRSVYA